MTIEELARVQVYLVTYIALAVLEALNNPPTDQRVGPIVAGRSVLRAAYECAHAQGHRGWPEQGRRVRDPRGVRGLLARIFRQPAACRMRTPRCGCPERSSHLRRGIASVTA